MYSWTGKTDFIIGATKKGRQEAYDKEVVEKLLKRTGDERFGTGIN